MRVGNKFILALVALFPGGFAFPQSGLVDSALVPAPVQHYIPEYALDQASGKAWQGEKRGLNAAFGSENKLYFRTEVPDVKNRSSTWQATGWKGERLNIQIVIWSRDALRQIRLIASDLRNEKGKLLSKNGIVLRKICYVLSNYPYGDSSSNCGNGPVDKAFLMPDRFEEFDRFNLPAETVRPVWLSLNIPMDAAPGLYEGTIRVRSESEQVVLHINIRVQNRTLPSPHDWKFRLDLWQNPWVIADYFHVKPWSEEHQQLLRQHLKLYADAGGTYITTYAVHSPWGDNEYHIEGGMIEWIRRKNGSWKFDYHIFDEYVELAMGMGIDKAITIYTPLPWGERFRYMDEATGNYIYEQWLPSSAVFKTNWNIFLTDLKQHLERKGWFNRTYLGVNENAMDQTLAAIRVIRAHSKQWKITYAGDWHQELDTLLDDYSSVFGKEPVLNEVKNRSLAGRTSTFYICCTPPKPNTFLFSPPVEARWLGWYAYAHHYDGFLRWAYDSWPEDPMRDGRYLYWPAGDCFLVYPGGAGSLRFEKLREGIADYEKIRIIKQLAARTQDREVKKLLGELEAHLSTFNAEKDFNEDTLKEEIDRGITIINELTDKLGATK